MGKFFLVFILTVCYGCTSTSKEQQLLGHYNHWHIEKYSKEEGIHICGIGGAAPNKINAFILDYNSEKIHSVAKARKLIVRLIEGMVEKVNSEGIHPELYTNFPITQSNVEIMISFARENIYYHSPPNVALMYNVNGIIYYRGWDKARDNFFDLHVETYEEALEKIRSSGCTQN